MYPFGLALVVDRPYNEVMRHDGLAINGSILRWAREIAGLSLEDAAIRAKIGTPRNLKGHEYRTAGDCLRAWEDGQEKPTISQLKLMSKAYQRPLITFFLTAPPKQENVFVDLRTIMKCPSESIEFAALKRHIISLHRELDGILKDENANILPFVNSANESLGTAKIVESISATLGLDAGWQIKKEKFKYLRSKAQGVGVFVTLMGDLGNYKSKIAVDEFRGMAIADQRSPLIVINSNDAEVGKLFTLAHELTHIWLGNSSISNIDPTDPNSCYDKIERFCNDVAVELLIPQSLLVNFWQKSNGELLGRIKSLALKFFVSEQVLARRLADLQVIRQEEFRYAVAVYATRLSKVKQQVKKFVVGKISNATLKYKFGSRLINTFTRAFDSGAISLLDAVRTLEIPAGSFMKVF